MLLGFRTVKEAIQFAPRGTDMWRTAVRRALAFVVLMSSAPAIVVAEPAASPPTFTKHVARILLSQVRIVPSAEFDCSNVARHVGGRAPVARSIRQRVASRQMPPWDSPLQGPPRGIASTLSGIVGQPLTLALWAADDAVVDPDRKAGDSPVTIKWSKYRGPGDVTSARRSRRWTKVMAARQRPPHSRCPASTSSVLSE